MELFLKPWDRMAEKANAWLFKVLPRIPLKRRYCNICKTYSAYFGPFSPYKKRVPLFRQTEIVGGGYRKDVVCYKCGALDRHRWIWYVIEHDTDILSGPDKVLHIAPERKISALIKEMNPQCDYITGDINPGPADICVDIRDMSQFADHTFDYIIMNHVIEHVREEGKALQELKRCLKEDGKLFLSFPFSVDRKTYENSEIVSEKERLFHYGQEDHCRLYGYDCKTRLEEYGFCVKTYTVQQKLSAKEYRKMGMLPKDTVFICTVDD